MHLLDKKNKALTLVEVLVSSVLVAFVLAMTMGAVVALSRVYANERTIAFVPASGTAAGVAPNWGYQNIGAFPSFPVAPSRLADAQAESLFSQMKEIYEQSRSVGLVKGYVIYDTASPFQGSQGVLIRDQSGGDYLPLLKTQLRNLGPVLTARFPTTFYLWENQANFATLGIDANSLRTATLFFLDSNDRLLAMLRMRAWEMSANTDPYRYYEVSLVRYLWSDSNTARNNAASPSDPIWVPIAGGNNVVEDFSYRFAEDKLYPQNLIWPPTDAQLDSIAAGTSANWNWPTDVDPSDNAFKRNCFVRFAKAGENSTASGTPESSRTQVSLTPLAGGTALDAGVDEWHLILPDPSLSQAEDRANLRKQVNNNNNLTLDKSYRRQGKYGCVLSIYP